MTENVSQFEPRPLDDAEIDRLMSAASAKQPAVAAPSATAAPAAPNGKITILGARRSSNPAPKIEAVDFRKPALLSEADLRRLRVLHDEFIRYLSARLSLQLRMECTLTIANLTTVTYSQYTESLAGPTHISLFKVEPLIGIGILDFSPRLALTMADRLLGGRGHAAVVERGLTEIEVALLEDVLTLFLDEWCGQWRQEQELRPMLIGHETTGRFLQTAPKEAVVLSLVIDCKFGECQEQIRLGVPYYMVDALVKKMQARRQKDSAIAQSARRTGWQAAFDHITVPVRAEWNPFEIPLREVACLRVGDVLELRPEMCSETQILLNGTPKFAGTVGLDSDRVAVRLSRKLQNEDTNHAQSHGPKTA